MGSVGSADAVVVALLISNSVEVKRTLEIKIEQFFSCDFIRSKPPRIKLGTAPKTKPNPNPSHN